MNIEKIQANVNNKLTPIDNLLTLIESGEVTIKAKEKDLQYIVDKEVLQCIKSLKCLTNLKSLNE